MVFILLEITIKGETRNAALFIYRLRKQDGLMVIDEKERRFRTGNGIANNETSSKPSITNEEAVRHHFAASIVRVPSSFYSLLSSTALFYKMGQYLTVKTESRTLFPLACKTLLSIIPSIQTS